MLAFAAVVSGFLAIVDRVAASFADIITPASRLSTLVAGDLQATFGRVPDATANEIATAWAAGLGSPRAIAALESLFTAADAHLRARGHAADVAVEATQRARIILLTGDAAPPAIFAFAGRGALGAFVRVVCVRQALQQARDTKRRAVIFDELRAHASDGSDPELDVLRGQYREQVDRAMLDAWAKLSRHDRFVLSLHLHARHSISEIATVYGIHRVNAARKLAAARTALIQTTRLLLQDELGVSSATASSVLRLTPFGLSVGQLAPATDVGRALRRDT